MRAELGLLYYSQVSQTTHSEASAQAQTPARVTSTLRVDLRFDTIGEFVNNDFLDLSAGGAFLRTDQARPVGTLFALQLQLADRGFFLSGRVTRCVGGGRTGGQPGLGIEFTGVSRAAAAELAAVAGADGAAPASRPAALGGRLEQLGLSSLIVMLEMERKQGVVRVRNDADARVGQLHFRNGNIVGATIGEDKGVDCVFEMMFWEKGSFAFNPQVVNTPDTIRSSPTSLLIEGARLADERNR